MDFNQDFRDMLVALNDAEVDYLVVGAYAVAAHGFPRATGDATVGTLKGGALSGRRLLVQGITGREGAHWTERMLDYGTQVLAGVTPGKGGQTVHGLPVYNTVAEAAAAHDVSMSLLFVLLLEFVISGPI